MQLYARRSGCSKKLRNLRPFKKRIRLKPFWDGEDDAIILPECFGDEQKKKVRIHATSLDPTEFKKTLGKEAAATKKNMYMKPRRGR